MQIDFHDRPVENEFDRMFDYDADGVLNPLEQSYKLDFTKMRMKIPMIVIIIMMMTTMMTVDTA